MIEFLLLDLDDTILDFHKAEHVAISKTLLRPQLLERESTTRVNPGMVGKKKASAKKEGAIKNKDIEE